MPADNSFDIVCKIDMQEVTNGLDQARREIDTRYDLKGSKNEIELEKTDIKVTAPDEMKLKAVVDILQSRLHKRGVPLKALTFGTVETGGGGVLRQKIGLQQGIPDREGARDRAAGQGRQAQGPGRDPGGPGPRVRQEQGRPAAGDGAAAGEGPGHRAAVHELSIVVLGGSAPLPLSPPAFRASRLWPPAPVTRPPAQQPALRGPSSRHTAQGIERFLTLVIAASSQHAGPHTRCRVDLLYPGCDWPHRRRPGRRVPHRRCGAAGSVPRRRHVRAAGRSSG